MFISLAAVVLAASTVLALPSADIAASGGYCPYRDGSSDGGPWTLSAHYYDGHDVSLTIGPPIIATNDTAARSLVVVDAASAPLPTKFNLEHAGLVTATSVLRIIGDEVSRKGGPLTLRVADEGEVAAPIYCADKDPKEYSKILSIYGDEDNFSVCKGRANGLQYVLYKAVEKSQGIVFSTCKHVKIKLVTPGYS